MNLTDSLDDYLRYIKHEQGVSSTTYKTYHSSLFHYLEWLIEHGYPTPLLTDFNASTIRRYFYAISERGLRPRTVHGYIIPLRSYGEYLIKMEVCTENPARVVQLPKKDAPDRTEASEADILAILEAVERQRNPRTVAFQRAVLAVLIYTGVRRAELCDLLLTDIDLAGRWLLVRSGKCAKSRKIPLCEPACDALAAYLPYRPEGCKHDYLFAVDRRRRLHFNGLRELVEGVKALAGLAHKKNLTPHCFRHSCASRLMRQGGSLLDVMTWLGHSQISTTQRYLHTSEEQLQKIAHLANLQRQNQKQAKDEKIIRLPQRDDRQERLRHRIPR